ncbi:RHS repeat-associated core domain-containing protein [Pseudomonas fluorescens]|uniref:RHS repeat-associated core domain-containing protein n=1 Tax=Pseudomonas fluorescens TaxID=294 RepID=A0A5E6Y2R7_PSEFL|nr:RHS repeat-associated core domain-containing protein [Pseudomonas fluorescens]VVN47780.1 hypothetical protein PS655_06010 [Pseudomonas fluorescens]
MEDELEPRAADYLSSVLGFNGERIDPVLGGYHLGNGYRLYSPTLRRFTSPDSMSPFGKGGINPYAYCEGDPINNTDPSGHFHVGRHGIEGIVAAAAGAGLAVLTGGSSLAVAGAVLGGISAATGIAADNTKGTAHSVLGGISRGTAIAGSIANIADIGVSALQASPIGKLAEHGPFALSGRPADAANAARAMRNGPTGSSTDLHIREHFRRTLPPAVFDEYANANPLADAATERPLHLPSHAAANADPVADPTAGHLHRPPSPAAANSDGYVEILPAPDNSNTTDRQINEHFQRIIRPKAPRQVNDESFTAKNFAPWRGGPPPPSYF